MSFLEHRLKVLKKKARKVERKAKELEESLEKDKSAKPKKAEKADKNSALKAQLLLAEKKRDEYLENSKTLEAEAQKLLKQAEEATEMYKQITEAIEVKHSLSMSFLSLAC